jgi:DNA processing protein
MISASIGNISLQPHYGHCALSAIGRTSMPDYDEDIYWLALSYRYSVLNLEPLLSIYERHRSLRYLWDISPTDLVNSGLNRELVAGVLMIRKSIRLEDCDRLRERLKKRGVKLIKYFDEDYPSQLKLLRNQKEGLPIFLLHSGALTDFQKCVAIVGTRVLSQYGHTMARKLAKQLASKGFTIVSGLARGTDTEAHCGALEAARGRTIAISPWFEPIYPEENSKLALDIGKRGCILSEFYAAAAGGMIRSAFVRRNRITSGLSSCVIAIESDETGGTAHQVDFALAQRRVVFVLKPRSEDTGAQRGYKRFVKQGAVPFKKAETILEYLRGHEPSIIDNYVRQQEDLRVHLQ